MKHPVGAAPSSVSRSGSVLENLPLISHLTLLSYSLFTGAAGGDVHRLVPESSSRSSARNSDITARKKGTFGEMTMSLTYSCRLFVKYEEPEVMRMKN